MTETWLGIAVCPCSLTFQIVNDLFCRTFAIVGLTNKSYGRSCNNHETCGIWVEIGSVVRVSCVQVWRRGRYHNDLEVYFVEDGLNTCKVGYLAKQHEVESHELDGQMLQVVDIYTDSDDDITRRRLHYQNYGFAMAILLDH